MNYEPIGKFRKTLNPRKKHSREPYARQSMRKIRKRVISVGLSPEPGFRKLTLECGHIALSNSEMAPHSVECITCKAGEKQK